VPLVAIVKMRKRLALLQNKAVLKISFHIIKKWQSILFIEHKTLNISDRSPVYTGFVYLNQGGSQIVSACLRLSFCQQNYPQSCFHEMFTPLAVWTGRGHIMFSISSYVRPSVCYKSCKHNSLQMNELILLQMVIWARAING